MRKIIDGVKEAKIKDPSLVKLLDELDMSIQRMSIALSDSVSAPDPQTEGI